MVLCEECGYDLRGSLVIGACPECNAPYDQNVLQADQGRSYRTVTTGLKIVAALSVLYFINSMCWIVAENFLRLRGGRIAFAVTMVGIPGGAALLLVLGLLLLRVQHLNRNNRPYYDPRQARLIPRNTRWWIYFNIITLSVAMFFSWGNPLWNALFSYLRSVL